MPADTDHPVFQQPPDPSIRIWRYMDFAKYVSLLVTKELWFSCTDKLGESFEGKLGDPFEGTFSRATAEELRKELLTLIRGGELPKETNIDEMVESQVQGNQWLREWTYVNSWHMNERESAAMWRLYARTNEAVAIQSTYARLRDCLPSAVEAGKPDMTGLSDKWVGLPSAIYMGKVQYRDYATEPMPIGNAFHPFMFKRKSFEHEREVRAVIPVFPLIEDSQGLQRLPNDLTNLEAGKSVRMSLEDLVEGVYVAPSAPNWFREVVEAVTREYGLAHKPIRSSLDEKPLY